VQLGAGLTNNEAEATALHLALLQLEDLQLHGTPHLTDAPLRIFGDSQLVIKWHLGLFKKVGKASLYQQVHGAKDLIKRHRWTAAFRNVPRHLNAAADDMATQARSLEGPGRITVLPHQVQGLPQVDLEAVYEQQRLWGPASHTPKVAAAAPIMMEAAGRPCKVCGGLHGEGDMLLCDRCNCPFHQECLTPVE
jgi:ribonuclease HI